MDEQDPAVRELARRAREAEEALAALADRVDRLFDRGDDPLLAVDPSGTITAANRAAVRVFGEGVVGTAIGSLLRDPAAALPGPGGLDQDVVLRDGARAWVRITPGERGAVWAIRDVTARTARRDEIESGRRLAAVGRIAGGIAHEINNPLTVLQLRADLLLEERNVPTPIRQQLGVLRESTSRIARTVRTLQRIARPSAGSIEWVAIAQVVNTACEAVRAPDLVHRIDVEAPPPVGVRGDAASLALAVEQIVAAAADQAATTVRCRVDGDRVVVEATVARASWANGVVADPTTTPDPADGRSAGIGLVVASAIAREHGGEVRTFRSPSSSTVALSLPLAPEVPPSRYRARVLVVHDDPLVAAMVTDWGRRGGHDVTAVRAVAPALGTLDSAAFDAVLADDALGPDDRAALAARVSAGPVVWIGRTGPGPSTAPLHTPFTRRQLAQVLDTVLGGR
ncbi:MAG: histidine kinase dimerization/phospho-acceptor domain-containing protein [Myxococcota bacterium]